MRPRFVALFVGSSLVLTSVSCKRASRQAEDVSVGEHAQLDGRSGTISIGSDAGTLSAALGAQPPEDFPKVIPIYTGAKIVFAAKSSQAQGAPSWTVTLESGDAKDKIVDFYKGHMPAFKLATSMDMGETSMCVWQSPQYDATLMATAEADQKTSITITATGR